MGMKSYEKYKILAQYLNQKTQLGQKNHGTWGLNITKYRYIWYFDLILKLFVSIIYTLLSVGLPTLASCNNFFSVFEKTIYFL